MMSAALRSGSRAHGNRVCSASQDVACPMQPIICPFVTFQERRVDACHTRRGLASRCVCSADRLAQQRRLAAVSRPVSEGPALDRRPRRRRYTLAEAQTTEQVRKHSERVGFWIRVWVRIRLRCTTGLDLGLRCRAARASLTDEAQARAIGSWLSSAWGAALTQILCQAAAYRVGCSPRWQLTALLCINSACCTSA